MRKQDEIYQNAPIRKLPIDTEHMRAYTERDGLGRTHRKREEEMDTSKITEGMRTVGRGKVTDTCVDYKGFDCAIWCGHILGTEVNIEFMRYRGAWEVYNIDAYNVAPWSDKDEAVTKKVLAVFKLAPPR